MASLNPILTPARLAIVGMAKNCGKTTTLNVLSTAYREADRPIGLVSIGIDGEASDVLIGTPKPPVAVREGDLIVTADTALEKSDATFEWVESLGIRTPLGEAVMARALDSGEVILGGLRHRGDVDVAVDRMRHGGAEHVLIDGAYGRVMAASPDVSDGVILSTGAVVSDSVDELVDETISVLERLMLGRCEQDAERDLCERAVVEGRALLDGASGVKALPSSSALLGLQRGRELWNDGVATIAIPGLVSDGVIEELLSLRRGGSLVVPDATSIQCNATNFKRLLRVWNVSALQTISLRAVAINPTSVRGGKVDGQDFARRIITEIPNLTVFNPLLGLHSLA